MAESNPEGSGGSGRLIAAVALAAALMPLNSTMVAVALPNISRELDAHPAMLTQALVASYLLTSIVLQSPGGKLGDRLGHRRALALGQGVLASGACLGFFAASVPLLAMARVLMAAGGAIVVPSAAALLRTELPVERRGRAFGAFGAVMALAAALGPIVGGEIVRRFGWPSIFLANVPVLALSAGLAFVGVSGKHAPAQAEARPFDLLGSALLGISLTLVVLGLRGHGQTAALLVVLGVVSFVPFVSWERRVSDPVIDFSLFSRKVFTAGCLVIALQNLALYALIFELPHTLERIFAMDARATGRLLVFMMAAMVVTSPLAGRLADRFGSRPIAALGSLSSIGGVVLMLVRPLDTPGSLIVSLILLGAGLALASAPAQSASMSAAPREMSGMAAGLSSTMRYVGGIAGVAVLGLVMTDDPDRVTVLAQHHAALRIFLVSLVLSLGCTLLLPSKGRLVNPAT